MQISIEQSGSAGRYLGRLEGVAEAAEIVFSRADTGCLVAEHTFVPEGMRGSGAGVKLIERIVEDARRGGYRVLAMCPYVRAQAARHAEWSDVLDRPPA
ncbi:MAG: N-acetyltransferase [Rhodocyclaceae bacterium]|nr:N-acetyltransferase [Rhodocyclaceae bacterium]MBX3670825.1 N-acetyltransferase [Rhodocyclaceae bacterium]